jgi:hypothetical protein
LIFLNLIFYSNRTVHDIKKKVAIRDVSLANKTRKFSDDMVFGTANRPSTPIVEVLQNRFYDNWLETMQNKQAALIKSRTDAAVNYSIECLFYDKIFFRMLLREVIIQSHHFSVKLKFLLIQNHYGKCRNLLK